MQIIDDFNYIKTLVWRNHAQGNISNEYLSYILGQIDDLYSMYFTLLDNKYEFGNIMRTNADGYRNLITIVERYDEDEELD